MVSKKIDGSEALSGRDQSFVLVLISQRAP